MAPPGPGTKFDPAVHFQEGDLIYGLNSQRFLMSDLIFTHLNSRDVLVSADHLNNQFLGTGVSGAGKNYGMGTNGSPQHKPAAQEYQRWLEARTTHNGAKQVLSDAMKTAVEDEDNLYDAPQRFSRIARSCKSGIVYATVEKSRKIHFIITGVDMLKTVTKPDEAEKWITAKELRSVFRRWDNAAIRDNVWFWDNEVIRLPAPVPDGRGGTTNFSRSIKSVKAPWVADPTTWLKYKPTTGYRLLDPNAPEFKPPSRLNPNAPVFVPSGVV